MFYKLEIEAKHAMIIAEYYFVTVIIVSRSFIIIPFLNLIKEFDSISFISKHQESVI